MSEIVRYKGKAILIHRIFANETLEQQCKYVIEQELFGQEIKMPEYCESYVEWIQNDFYDKYMVKGNSLYKLEYEKMDCEYEFYEGKCINDAITEFHVMYYNGGGDLHEAICQAIDNA